MEMLLMLILVLYSPSRWWWSRYWYLILDSLWVDGAGDGVGAEADDADTLWADGGAVDVDALDADSLWADGAGDGGGAEAVQGGTQGGGKDGQGGTLILVHLVSNLRLWIIWLTNQSNKFAKVHFSVSDNDFSQPGSTSANGISFWWCFGHLVDGLRIIQIRTAIRVSCILFKICKMQGDVW